MLKNTQEIYRGFNKKLLRNYCFDGLDYTCNLCPFPQRIFIVESEEQLFDHLIDNHKEYLVLEQK